MALADIELNLSDEERAVRDSAHRFAAEVMRPAGAALDRLHDPADVCAKNSVLWGVFEKYRELGMEEAERDPAMAQSESGARMRALVNEELGWGDAGLAISLTVAGFPALFATMLGKPELIERFAAPGSSEIGCWAITEPNHGSDMLAFDQPVFEEAGARADCIATRDGDDYVINGQKAAWVSNGTIATVATLFCQLDPSGGFKASGVALVPLDLPGVSRGAPLNKLGQRALNQGEVFFEDVRIPADYMIVEPDMYLVVLEMILTMANAHMATIFVGVARAALEHALAYSKERVQGGVPIFEHQAVKLKLFKMFAQVEAARSLARRAFLYNATQQPPLVQYSIAAKTFCTQTAFDVASLGLQVFGGNGLSREYPIEKLLRDARASMIEDGCNDMLSLVGAEKL